MRECFLLGVDARSFLETEGLDDVEGKLAASSVATGDIDDGDEVKSWSASSVMLPRISFSTSACHHCFMSMTSSLKSHQYLCSVK